VEALETLEGVKAATEPVSIQICGQAICNLCLGENKKISMQFSSTFLMSW